MPCRFWNLDCGLNTLMNLANKKIVVVGLGRTGLASAAFLQQQGARVLVSDTASGLLGALSNLLLVILTMVFMLVEAQTMPGKLRSPRPA